MSFSLFPLSNFPNEIFATIFSILFIIILISELRILLRNKNQKDDKNSLNLILLGTLLPLFLIVTISFTEIGRTRLSLAYTGLLILILGFLLRQHSIRTLGKFFYTCCKKRRRS